MAARSQLRLVSELTELAAGVNVTKDEIPHNYFYPGYEEDELAQIQAALITPRPNELKRRGSTLFGLGSDSFQSLDPRDLHSNLDSSLLNSSSASTAIPPSGLYRRGSVSVEDALFERDDFEDSLENAHIDEVGDPDVSSDEDTAPYSRYYKNGRTATQKGKPRLFEAGGKGDALISFGKKAQREAKQPGSLGYHERFHTAQQGKEDDDIAELLAIMTKTEKNRMEEEKQTTVLKDLDLDFLPSDGESEGDLDNIAVYPSNTPTVDSKQEQSSDDLEALAEESLPSFPRGTSFEASAPHGKSSSLKNAEYPVLASGRRRHRYDHYDDHLNEYVVSAPKPSQPHPQNRGMSNLSSRVLQSRSDRLSDPSSRPKEVIRENRPVSALAYALPAKVESSSSQRERVHRPSIQVQAARQEKKPPTEQTNEGSVEKYTIRRAMKDVMKAISYAKDKEGTEYCTALTRALAITTPVLGTLHPMSVRISTALVGWLCAHASADFATKKFAKSMTRLDQALSITSLVSPSTLKRVIETLDSSSSQIIESAKRSFSKSMQEALWIEIHRLGIAPLVELFLSPALPILAAARLTTLGLAATVTRSGGAIRRTLIVLRERLAIHSLLIRAEKHPLIVELLLSSTRRLGHQEDSKPLDNFSRSSALNIYRNRLVKLLSFSGVAYNSKEENSSKGPQADVPENEISGKADGGDHGATLLCKYDAERDYYDELFQGKQNTWADAKLWRALIGDFSESSLNEPSNTRQSEELYNDNEVKETLSREERREIQFKASGDALESLYPISSWLQRAVALCSSLSAERMCGGSLLECFVSKSLSNERDSGGQPFSIHDSKKVIREAKEAAGAGCGAASTHLNLCAIYSTLASHDKALYHAETATSLIQQELLNVELPTENKMSKEDTKSPSLSEPVEKATRKLVRDKLTLLCVSHHNAAVELEHLRDYQSSYAAYMRAAEIARDTLCTSGSAGMPQNRLANQLEQAAKLAAEQVSSLIKQQEAERERRLYRMGTGRSSSALLRHNSSKNLRSSTSLASNVSQSNLRSRPQSASRQGRASSSNLNLRRTSTQK